MSDFALNVIGNVARYQEELAKVPGITEKQAAAAALKFAQQQQKGQVAAAKSAQDAAAKAAKAWEGASAGIAEGAEEAEGAWKRVEEATGGAGDAAKKLRGIAGSISPEFADLAGALDDVGDAVEGTVAGVEGLGGAFAPLALVVAAAAAGWIVYSRNVEIAEERSRLLAQQSDDLREAIDRLQDAQLEAAVAAGRMTEGAAAQLAATRNVTREIEALAKAHAEERKAAEDSLRSNDATAEALRSIGESGLGMTAVIAGAIDAVGGFSARADAAAIKLADMDEAFEAQTVTIRQAGEATRQAAEDTETKRLADEAATAAAKAATAAEKARTAAKREAEQAARDLAEAEKKREDQIDATIDRALANAKAQRDLSATIDALDDTETERIEKQKQRYLDEIARIEARSGAHAQAAADRVKVEAWAEKQIAKVREEEELRIAELKQQGVDTVMQNLAIVANVVKDKSLAGFRFYQGLAVTQIAMDTAQGVMKAIATFTPIPGIGPALAAAAAGAITAAGIAQTGEVLGQSPPSFGDTPGVMKMQRGGQVGFADDDYFAAAKDPAELRRQVGGGGGPSYQVYNSHVFGRSIRDDVRLPNPLRTAITSAVGGRATGLRDRRAA